MKTQGVPRFLLLLVLVQGSCNPGWDAGEPRSAVPVPVEDAGQSASCVDHRQAPLDGTDDGEACDGEETSDCAMYDLGGTPNRDCECLGVNCP